MRNEVFVVVVELVVEVVRCSHYPGWVGLVVVADARQLVLGAVEKDVAVGCGSAGQSDNLKEI